MEQIIFNCQLHCEADVKIELSTNSNLPTGEVEVDETYSNVEPLFIRIQQFNLMLTEEQKDFIINNMEL